MYRSWNNAYLTPHFFPGSENRDRRSLFRPSFPSPRLFFRWSFFLVRQDRWRRISLFSSRPSQANWSMSLLLECQNRALPISSRFRACTGCYQISTCSSFFQNNIIFSLSVRPSVCLSIRLAFFVADGINSVGDYNSPPGGCRLSVCVSVCPHFFSRFTIG